MAHRKDNSSGVTRLMGFMTTTRVIYLRRVSKGIRQPEDFAIRAKVLLVEPLSVEELAAESLSTGYVAIHLNPGGSNHLEATRVSSCLNLLEQLWVVLREPL